MSLALLVVYFVYGLAFLAMGLALMLEAGRASSKLQVLRLGWLASFGIIHGSHEWLEAYLLQAQAAGAVLPAWLGWLRLVLLAVSFACLLAFAAISLAAESSRPAGRLLAYAGLGSLEIVVLAGAITAYRGHAAPWVYLMDAMSRYLLAVPAGFLASAALVASAAAAGTERRSHLAANLRIAALGFAAYASTQVVVHQLQFFPADVINQAAFVALTGLPIQLVRSVTAVVIAFGLLRSAQAAESERQTQLLEAHAARLSALEQRDALRRDLLRHVVRSQEDERARIARELHDEVAQLLSAFSLELGTLRTKLRRADTTQMVDRLQERARQMSQSLYHLVRDLRPSQLDGLGLVPALQFLFRQDCEPRGLQVALRVTGNARPLDSLTETALYRVAQEGLANAARHARINSADVELEYAADEVTLRISDAGRGFDPAEEFYPPRGWGLAGMRERVDALGGRLCVRSSPGNGTTVEAVVPSGNAPGEELANGTDHVVARG